MSNDHGSLFNTITICISSTLRQLYNRKTTTSQSARSLRSVRTKSNASLRRSCLLTRSANASQVQIVAQAASQSGEVDYRSVATASPLLPQRRCQSLGRFPGDEVDEDGKPRQQTDEYQQSGMVSCQRPRQFLCVPQVFPSNKSSQRRRKESQSLDVFPSELRSTLSQRSPLASCASQDDMEDERSRLLGSEEHNVTLTIPNGDQAEQLELSRPINGHVKTCGYQPVRLIHNDDEGIDVNSESLSSRTQPSSSLTACGDQEKRWHSCEQLHSTSAGEKQRGRENKVVDTAIASNVNKGVKQWQWLVNLFGVRHAGDNFSRSPQTGEEFSDLHRDDRESVV